MKLSTSPQSLNDWPGKIVFPVLVHGCNFSCPFCFVPHLLDTSKGETESQVLEKISQLDKNYFDAILVSGGEPTIHSELPDFLQKIRDLGWKIRLFTNGSNPQMLRELVSKKLVDSIAMDVKHTKEKYNLIANPDMQKIEESMKLVAGTQDYEFRTTLVKKFHDKEDATEIMAWITKVIGSKPRYRVQGFYSRAPGYLDNSLKNEKQFLDEEIRELNKELF